MVKGQQDIQPCLAPEISATQCVCILLSYLLHRPWNIPGKAHTPWQEQGFRGQHFIYHNKNFVRNCSVTAHRVLELQLYYSHFWKKLSLTTIIFHGDFRHTSFAHCAWEITKAILSSFNKSILATCSPHVKSNEISKALLNLSNCETPYKMTQIIFLSSTTALKTCKDECCEQR